MDEMTKGNRRAVRRSLTKRAIEKQVQITKVARWNFTHKQPHRFAKHHALDCGQPRCVCCGNPRQIFGQKTLQEIKADQAEKYDGI